MNDNLYSMENGLVSLIMIQPICFIVNRTGGLQNQAVLVIHVIQTPRLLWLGLGGGSGVNGGVTLS
jgi:hypothetical protein